MPATAESSSWLVTVMPIVVLNAAQESCTAGLVLATYSLVVYTCAVLCNGAPLGDLH